MLFGMQRIFDIKAYEIKENIILNDKSSELRKSHEIYDLWCRRTLQADARTMGKVD